MIVLLKVLFLKLAVATALGFVILALL